MKFATAIMAACLGAAALLLPTMASAQTPAPQPAAADDSDIRPAVTEVDLRIVKRARELLDSPTKWNRADNRKCPEGARVFSLYCALQTATVEVGGKFEHRGAALQEMRFVIDEIAATRKYDHRLMDYNNDPVTSFADVQEVLRITESLIALRLEGNLPTATSPVRP